ncbi:MAG TPA: phosphopantetheine-binding protein [Ruminiclostridium sp.]|nr:phosphopantetheine-binding protein [Ruminiclostridium sp.]
MSEETLEFSVKKCIIERLNLDIAPEDIDDDMPIFKNPEEDIEAEGAATDETKKGLGLDSVDALEIVVAINEEFGVEVTDNDMMIFQSVSTIADFIREKTGE